MASTIPPPHVPLAPGSSSLLDVPRPGAPSLFLIPRLLHPNFCLVFCCITFLSVLCFLSFFTVSVDLLRASFAALRSLLSFFRAPTATSFHRALLCTGSTYTRSVSFLVFLFACIQLCCFSFPCISLLFACNNALASMVRLDPL
jgi:hypothetical protein